MSRLERFISSNHNVALINGCHDSSMDTTMFVFRSFNGFRRLECISSSMALAAFGSSAARRRIRRYNHYEYLCRTNLPSCQLFLTGYGFNIADLRFPPASLSPPAEHRELRPSDVLREMAMGVKVRRGVSGWITRLHLVPYFGIGGSGLELTNRLCFIRTRNGETCAPGVALFSRGSRAPQGC